jgi:oxygen-independent coproporphyrinogen-3 oxidase
MPVDRRLERAYWLYWRVYELKILDNDFQDLFGNAFTLDSVFSNVLKPFEMAGMIEKKNGGYYVTEPGAYWIHRLQNEYSLNYINRLWGSCRREAWPEEVFL